MTPVWPEVSLSQVLQHRKEFIRISDEDTYKRCRVQLHARGVVLRDVVTGAEIKTKEQQVCHANEFLVAEIDAKVGGYGIVPAYLEGAIVSSHYFLFRVNSDVLDVRFLDYFIRTLAFRDQITARGSTNYAAIRPSTVLGYKIPLPPLCEQYRIVARIEALAGKIEEACGLRREAVDETEVILLSTADEVFSALARTSGTRSLRGTFRFRNDLIRPGDGHTGNLCFVGLQHVESATGRRLGQDYMLAEELDGRKFQFSPGEIVYGYLRPYLNKVWIADCEGICSVDQYVLRPDKHLVDTRYLAAYMRSPMFLRQANALTNNLMLPRLRSALLESVQIPLPAIAEQIHAAEYLEGFQTQVDALKRLQTETTVELDAMVPAVLDKAFKGKL